MIHFLLVSLAVGICLGIAFPTLFGIADSVSYVLLIALLVVVGVEIGSNRKVWIDLRKSGARILLVPLFVMGGSLVAGVIASFFLDINVLESLAISAGAGYYSLPSIILTTTVGSMIGALCFLTHLFREVITIAITPFISRYTALGPVASGGAASMDTVLPVILQYAEKPVGLVSVVNGVVLTICVPFAVTLFAGLL